MRKPYRGTVIWGRPNIGDRNRNRVHARIPALVSVINICALLPLSKRAIVPSVELDFCPILVSSRIRTFVYRWLEIETCGDLGDRAARFSQIECFGRTWVELSTVSEA